MNYAFTKYLIIPFLLLISATNWAFSQSDTPRSKIILVSIAPYRYFVERIAGDTVSIELLVPAGSSPHSYEPSARSILKDSKADAWFRIGEGFEKNAIKAVRSRHPGMKIVDLREGINVIYDHRDSHQCRHEDCRDPHIWLSPREAKKQAQIIYETLAGLYPENQERYRKALKKFQKDLDDLNHEIEKILQPLKERTIIVSHPAYAYFCRDYHLKQLSIEFEGREPSPRQLTKLLEEARKLHPSKIFVQKQHINKGARLIAHELNAEVVELNPLSENYIDNLRHIAKSIAGCK